MWRLRWMTIVNVRGHHQHSTEGAAGVFTFMLQGDVKKVEEGNRLGCVGNEQERKEMEHEIKYVRVRARGQGACQRSGAAQFEGSPHRSSSSRNASKRRWSLRQR